MPKRLPVGKVSRGAVVAKTFFKIGAKQTKSFVKCSLERTTKHSNIKEEMHKEIADVIFEALGELKGVSVKIAQQIALGMPFLSPIYLEKISQSFNSIPSLNKVLIRKIIKQELKDYPQNIFDSFENNAFAAASLGQVHKAEFKGEKLAVKIQYPGMKNSIKNDMTLIHFALKRFAKGHNVDHIIKEMEKRLYEEVESEIEAKNSEFFLEHIKSERIVIPKVYSKFSTSKILTTSLLEGKTFENFLLAEPLQEDIDFYAQLIFDNFFYSLYILGSIHADPNPGNFVFMDNKRLGLIDFGCIKKVNRDFLKGFTALHLGLIAGLSDEEIIPHYIDFGMIKKDTTENMLYFYREVIKPLDRLYLEPLMENSYDFKNNSDFSQKGFERIFEVQQKQFNSVHQINEEYIFIDRTLFGYYAIFEKMGAKIDTRYVKTIMNQFIKDK